jgi:hypothetical protein
MGFKFQWNKCSITAKTLNFMILCFVAHEVYHHN